jgi:hypothetical protein
MIDEQKKILKEIQPNQFKPVVKSVDNLEDEVRKTYAENYTDSELSSMTKDVQKNFYDSTYLGDMIGEQRFGLGTMTYNNGRTYFGEWREDRRHGRGAELYSNGCTYRGEY